MPKIPANPFILVDGSSYLFRAYHALPPLTTAKGQPTGAIFGVLNMLNKILSAYQPTRMVVVFDSKEKNFRHACYPAYKANRVVMPEDLQSQIEPLYATIRAMGLPLVMIPAVEADDVIGTLALQARQKGWFTLISTGDKDFAQLVDDELFLINTMSGDIFDREKVIEKFEVPPELMIDYLTLIGDSVDNIPGVPKVGPKTAVKWLKAYGNLENIIEHASEIEGKVGENLRNALGDLPLFRQLITIQLDVPIPMAPEDFVLKAQDTAALKTQYESLEFKNWLKMLIHKTEQNKPVEAPKNETSIVHYETVLDQKTFEKWFSRLEKAKVFAFDTETTGLDYIAAEIVGISFALAAHEAAYVPLMHDYEGAPEQLSREWVFEKMKPLLEDPNCFKVGHNLKYDAEVLQNHGIYLKGIRYDTMLESYVLDSIGNRHNMDAVAKRYLDYDTVSFEDIAGKGVKQLTFNQISLDKAGFYAAEDADITLRLHKTLMPRLNELPKQKEVFDNIEMPLVPVLAKMEYYGVLVDPGCLKEQSKELGERLEELATEAYQLAGQSFNINSPKQLQEILFDVLKLPVLEKTPTGQASTAEPVLQELAYSYELPKIVLEYRSLSKLKSTYTDSLPEQIHPKTGRVHTSYHQAVTSTGRLSSSDPNLQNIPIRRLEGRRIRTAFIAPPGYKIIAADYSQIELRILAHLSQDPGLLAAFQAGEDIHQSTASAVFGIPLNEVSSEQRRSAKAINFGLMYGMSAFGLAKQLGVSRDEAEKQIARYFNCFPKVRAFLETVRREAVETGYVETLLGRRLYLPDLKSTHVASRRAAERAAINAPMQGTNADIIKLAMIKLDHFIVENKLDSDVHMIMQVHDELVFEVRDKLVVTMKQKIKEIMETVLLLSLPLQVGIGIGNNWEEAH